MKYGCIGERLGHSFSKEIHNELASYSYELREIPKDKIDEFMRAADFEAINVTIPYKQAVIPHLDYISPIAEKIGAVNTVVNRGGKLHGYNTDFHGMKALIERMGLSLNGKRVAILGSGGTSKAACAVCDALGADEFFCVSRGGYDGSVTYEELYNLHTDIQIIINCTPVGMFPSTDDSPVDLDKLSCVEGVVDAVYNPLSTRLVYEARRRGIKAKSGLFMLVYQAVKASEFFLDTTYPTEITERIYKKMLKSKQSIVLTGMPASGKSTVGKLLAQALGKEFIDTDAEIEKRLGCTIPEIFERRGEGYFRQIEAQVVADVSLKNGAVIATGGGAILRDDNVRNLHKNSIVFFIDRSPENLFPTCDRPLASTALAIKGRYCERYGIYCKTADVRVDCDSLTPDEVCEIIIKEFENYENICN